MEGQTKIMPPMRLVQRNIGVNHNLDNTPVVRPNTQANNNGNPLPANGGNRCNADPQTTYQRLEAQFIDMQEDMRRFRKQHPSVLKGNADPLNVEQWMSMMGSTLYFMRVEGNKRVACETHMLRDDARIWWEVISQERDVTAMTWAEFQQAFNDKYYNHPVQASKVDEFATLSQRNMTVPKYALKFEKIAKFAADQVPTKVARVDRFVCGLKPMIARDVKIVSVGKRKGSDNAGQPGHDKSSKDNKGNNRTGNKEWVRFLECEKCKKRHKGECWANACHDYGKEGHIMKNYPQRSQEDAKEQPKKDGKLVPARVFALTKPQVEASTSMVSGQISIAGINRHILIDYGATHSFVA
ncbi:uncharacterized protein LOC133824540 [Humulus lupulus]|uniref:uncharacterized protein LOC133824540 n=1 Tax=Humulus lupulus TaxID=3486 RepID=UPI002B40D99A|nr:uncharacterized protein LOC133824540 [Humulus lupulus]